MQSFAVPQITLVRMSKPKRHTKDWIKAVATHLNISVSELARRSGIAPSTLTRYVNDTTGTLTVTERTLDAIAGYSGVAKHVMPGNRMPPGFGEPDALPLRDDEAVEYPAWVQPALEAMRAGRNSVEPWVVKSRALDLLGVLPGDILLIDENRRPKAGDIVCAQVTELASGSTETVMRRYDPPFIVAHSAKMGPQRPELVDDERVIITGVEAGLLRAPR